MNKSEKSQHDLFSATHWSVVNEARNVNDDQRAQAALGQLCETYWYPVYAYIRRRCHDAHRAEDITQGFFLVFIEKYFLASVDQDKGKFRAFLLASVKNYMANVHDYETARKRGGGLHIHSLHEFDKESLFNAASERHQTAHELFDHEWAMTLLQSVQQALKTDYEKAGNGTLFTALFHTLTTNTDVEKQSYETIAQELQMSESAVKVAVHRLRQRYKKRLREAVSHTVRHMSAIDQELHYLISCM